MNIWLIKCRESFPDHEGWSWDSYFTDKRSDYPRDDNWGGAGWIRSAQSKKYIRDDVTDGDLVVCYQYEGKRICGLTRMAGDGRDDPIGSKNYCMLFMAAAKKGLRVTPNISIADLRETGCDPEWLRKGQGTIFPLSKDEFHGIIRAIRILRSNLDARVTEWLNDVAYEIDVLPGAGDKGPALRKGGGFAVDPETRKKVERRAVELVVRRLRADGWEVRSVECDGCGFDLLCTKGSRRKDIEVKGVSGGSEQFQITSGEVTQARINKNFRLWLVTGALSKSPSIREWDGPGSFAAFVWMQFNLSHEAKKTSRASC